MKSTLNTSSPALSAGSAQPSDGDHFMINDPSTQGSTLSRASIVVVDDHKIIRETLRVLLADSETPVIGEADSSAAALARVSELKPDLVILDIRLPDENGLVTAARIHEQSPATKVLMLSGYTTPQIIKDALRARAFGFVTKQEPALECVRAVRNVLRGTIHLSPEAMRILAQEPHLHRP